METLICEVYDYDDADDDDDSDYSDYCLAMNVILHTLTSVCMWSLYTFYYKTHRLFSTF